jgi:hypothetical protein
MALNTVAERTGQSIMTDVIDADDCTGKDGSYDLEKKRFLGTDSKEWLRRSRDGWR